MLENKYLIIDFDSTFVKVETIDELAKIILENDSEQSFKIEQISKITNGAMKGKIDFQTALKKRLEILSLTKQDVIKVTEQITHLISDSFSRNKEFLLSNAKNILIVSGGFKEVIVPIVKEFGIMPEQVFANEFLYKEDNIIGCDTSNDLFKEKGKILAIENQNLNGIKIMVGDGYTDYEVFENGTADHFIYFSENVLRESVSNLTTLHATSFEDLMQIIKKL